MAAFASYSKIPVSFDFDDWKINGFVNAKTVADSPANNTVSIGVRIVSYDLVGVRETGEEIRLVKDVELISSSSSERNDCE
jgi:hypothetical protein